MTPSTPNPDRPQMEVRAPRASTVIVQHVPPEAADAFMEWQRGICAAAAEAPHYQTTEVYPPTGEQPEWVVVIHFDDARALEDWLGSPRRAEWLAKLPRGIRGFRQKTLPAGLGSWFAGIGAEGTLPPSWKIALAVLLQLYPTVMVLTLVVGPYLSSLGLAVSMLISNLLSVSLLQWAVTPTLNPVLGPWLRGNEQHQTRYSLGGLVVILLLLGVLTLLFRLIKG